MSQSQKTRREKLEAIVRERPDDAFPRYALAIECANTGDADAAISHFEELLLRHPAYVTGWFQYGQLLARIGRVEEARSVLRRGIECATVAGDLHARDEMQAALGALH